MGTSLHPYISVVARVIFILVSVISPLHANPVQENTREECRWLIEDGLEDINNRDYATALEKFMKVELMAQEHEWDDILWAAKNQIGIIYLYISDFSKALDYFQESYVLTQSKRKLYDKGAHPLNNIALLYLKEKNYEEALIYYNKAYDIAKRGNNLVVRKNIANNIANTYIKLDKADKSLEILKEEEAPVNHRRIDFMWKANFINVLSLKGEQQQAEMMAKELYEELRYKDSTDPREECFICIAEVLSEIYTDLNELDLALEFAKKGLKNSDELTHIIDFYGRISDLYYQQGNHKLAFHYKDSVLIVTDSLSVSINKSQYEVNKVRFKVQEYQTELQTNKMELDAKARQQKSERRLFTIVIIFSVIIVFFIYRGLRNKIIKQKQNALITSLELEKEKKEHILAGKQLETNRLKQLQLKHEIAEKNRELSAKALHLSSRNKLINDIISTLEAESKETVKQVKVIKDFMKDENHQEDFVKHFEKVNPVFIKRLKEKHPSLTSNDIRFLSYIFMNLSIKEISVILNITYNASRKRKRRIMDKMGLDSEKDSLFDYLLII